MAALALAALVGAATLVIGILPAQTGQPDGVLHASLTSLRTSVSSPAGGYWIVDAAGAVTSFGGAANYGSAPAHLNQPIVGIVSTSDGLGYWLVAKDGGVFAFGDAAYSGNALGTSSTGSVVGMTSVPGHGTARPAHRARRARRGSREHPDSRASWESKGSQGYPEQPAPPASKGSRGFPDRPAPPASRVTPGHQVPPVPPVSMA
jgi:hypothetical protein